MAERVCHHCKEVVEVGAPHDCWTTTEAAVTAELSEDLRDAWERVRETAADFGEQRIYASGHCILFARKTAYFFVRPKRSALELCIFLGRAIVAPQVRRADATSRTKIAHIIHVRHRDEVEAPITDWIREAYEVSDELSRTGARSPKTAKPPKVRPATASKAKAAKTPKARRAKPAKKTVKATAARKRSRKGVRTRRRS
jgi:hypothetical protein